MNKKRIFALVFLIQSFLVTLTLSAQGITNIGQNFTIPNPSRYSSLEDVVNALASLIRPVFIITFGAMVLYGGWVRLTSQGNPDKIKSSSQIIVAAIVGFAIAVFAPTIVDFIGRLIGIQGGLIQPIQ